MTKKIFITILLCVLTFAILLPKNISAANYGMSISPPLLRVHIKPGRSITQVYKIENLSNNDKTLVAAIVPFTESDISGNPVLNPKATAPWLSYFSLANSEIKFNKPFPISAGASEQLILSLSVPETAPLKDIYATLIVSTYVNSVDQTFQGSALRATIGSNLLITVSSQAYPDTILRIEGFYPAKGTVIKIGELYFADSITPLKFTATVNNEGSFTAETKGVFRVTSGKGKPVYLEGILPVNVIAKSQRQLLNTNGNSFEFSPSLSNIGSHQLSLEIKTDNSNTTSTINIIFFPLKLSLGLLISLLLIISIVRVTSKTPEKST
ncbi:TPA: hypothetical protein DCP77_01100 [Candidatus Collierbacteria bacterium]|uniref:Uncharacterized protein n=1 Tax=Candidatus Collierbacteria bacterium GW2011_GWA2_42_17 TaxID=1618378 RepID=A0A0G0Z163_9BACT|nr:MAG: hypothetical protein UU94_C0011G0006 [Candidatus Collierbacteria bacterium GW2011_GWB2_42_12]KKS42547.1 MAG: hypothetical protein UV06_C0010G0007 [Candidatus Collierbacteria bacterium GW2011_GWA2_42_17]KKS61686.1 MAG: hypothetical protein UV29_C0034G0007 [Candidatus Collierbacteria bacterium GW2011_GWD2_42_50]KKS62128.1 MAG: hypothetical protein UV28_C0017G0006 [Candidatus Collierbacteria bacterium GW2011_GWE2_42_48]KKS62150.1 MAG: hypothetical protein UV30_C0022G0006 [Candidatus Collie